MPKPRGHRASSDFTRGYIEAALWSSSDESDEQEGEPLDKNYTASDIDPKTMEAIEADCEDFVKRFGSLIEDDDSPAIEKWGRWDLAGHEFWLTRNGHGAGFGDGNFPKHDDELYEAAESYGSFELYVGDDGVIYAFGHEGPIPTANERGVTEAGRFVPLTDEQLQALRRFAQRNGRRWKERARAIWDHANPQTDDETIVYALRNTHGPSWLTRFTFPSAGVNEATRQRQATDAWNENIRRAIGTVGHNRSFTARDLAEYLWGRPGSLSSNEVRNHLRKLTRAKYLELGKDGYSVTRLGWNWIEGADEVNETHRRQPPPRDNVLAQTDSRFRPARPDRPIAEASVKGSDGVVYAARMYPEAVGTYGTASNLTLYFKRDGREWREIGWDSIPNSSYAALRRELAASRERLRGRVPEPSSRSRRSR